jgi:hypothetical protein
VVTAYPAVLLRSAVSFSSRSVGCRSFCGFLEGICLCSESTCIVNEIMRRGRRSQCSLPILFLASAAVEVHVTVLRIFCPDLRSNDGSSPHAVSAYDVGTGPCDLRSDVH